MVTNYEKDTYDYDGVAVVLPSVISSEILLVN